MVKFIKKTCLKGVFVLLLMNVFSACSDLEENPDFTTQDNFFNTAEQLELGVNAIYDGIGYGQDWENHFYNRFVFECLVGYQVGWEKGPLNYQNGNVSPDDVYISIYWRISYENINRANSIIAKADELKDAGATNVALIDRVKAEAQFLRAFYYYNLVRYFNNIPVTTSPTLSDQDLPSNENGEQKALELIQSDLLMARDILPESYGPSEAGRATRWAAEALLMKAYLQGEKWSEAYNVAQTIIDESGMSLFDDFANTFSVETENMGPRIFEAQVSASANAGENQVYHAHFVPADLPNDLGGVGWHWLNSTKDFREKYDPNDKRIAGTFIQEYPSNRVGRNDDGEWPIVRWSPDAPYNLSRFGGLVPADSDPNNPEELIYSAAWSAKYTEVGISNAYMNEKNIVYLRYADVLLGHSEAANESNMGDPYYGINEVRRRAGLTPLSGLSQSQLRDAIVNERVLEFAMESEVYPELKRKSTYGGSPDYLGDYIEDFIETYNVDRSLSPRDYVLPLPLNEVLGNPNVTQNPEYQ
ncbi:RagB/SusD family nutrient uptake outer membrane protein [Echinicola jeungdonensis]|uniref:RagB/SusD family nutrient uptake outer membrane protein n=1 Tax=Echinicola jeungdonensis TaxID=709343 RepID=A0ABV5J8M7_9BACT|nr:RagB/SusD family nutrient uptake outer membrane protein [Echinicola jeungdonensis]MDN3670306.1 RagB/SusD family nutrient uptake outer membrane protein [Echinicola jeungdonensis]MDN3670317.1 RagB/SusD family nutrient uptake outer membrane protein [Echinicola jeungdonensis]MDN3670352.1 RagB/SusD family nutrient uptake outer membrane protein [Echinicola jeungdonensis]